MESDAERGVGSAENDGEELSTMPNLHVAAHWSRPSPWSLPFEEVSSGLTGGEFLLRSSALKRSVGAASVLLWPASGEPVSGPSRACEGVTVAGGGVRLPLRAH